MSAQPCRPGCPARCRQSSAGGRQTSRACQRFPGRWTMRQLPQRTLHSQSSPDPEAQVVKENCNKEQHQHVARRRQVFQNQVSSCLANINISNPTFCDCMLDRLVACRRRHILFKLDREAYVIAGKSILFQTGVLN